MALGWSRTDLPKAAATRYTSPASQSPRWAYSLARRPWWPGLSPRVWSSVETPIRMPTALGEEALGSARTHGGPVRARGPRVLFVDRFVARRQTRPRAVPDIW